MEVAIKEDSGNDSKETMLDEAMAMIRVSKHDHIVNFQGVCVHQNAVYLLLEFCVNGQIDSYLRKNARQMITKLDNQNYSDLIKWCAQVADGMGFLITKNIIHVRKEHFQSHFSYLLTYSQVPIKRGVRNKQVGWIYLKNFLNEEGESVPNKQVG